VELLERDDALAALAEAREAAALGHGRVVFVTGEPGIGKTSLAARFVDGLEPGARVLVGTCDDLSIPRPLGALRDLVGSVSPPLEQALSSGAAAHVVQGLLIAELERRPAPTVLVLEDVHWADEATLDTITVLGRRMGSLPAVLLLTFRGGEVPPTHPLRGALGAIRAEDSLYLDLAPLSASAVGSLAGADADAVYAATGGNPFYVTELIASRDGELPQSVANVVLGRAARLGDDERRLVELVSVVPRRVRTSVLDVVMPDWPAAAEEPERRQLLEVDPGYVRFRHELARHAVQANIPAAARRRLHAEILNALLAADADPADVVHHAEAAGADDVVAAYALVAARRAAAIESNREAYSHYRRAADFLDRLPAAEQAVASEELARSAYVVGRLEDALPAIERAISVFASLGDQASVGRCTRVLSRLRWYGGEGALAWTTALEAIAILEPLGESVELARAYSGFSQLAMLAQEIEPAIDWGERALELAGRLGDERVRAHALVNLGTALLQLDPEAQGTLLEAHAVAHAAGDSEEAARALTNLAFTLLSWVRPGPARDYAERGLGYAEEHEVGILSAYSKLTLAWLQLRAGEWEAAERAVQPNLERGQTVAQLLGRTVLTELAVRRGDDDAMERLAALATEADRAGDLQRIAPVLELRTELALTADEPMPTERLRRLVEALRAPGRPVGWGAARMAAWASVAGAETEYDEPASPLFAAMHARDWRGAADAFGEVGWVYDRALMLSLLDDEESLADAIAIARALGAEPLTRRVALRMRELGMSVPRGPRESTRGNPAGLTARQLEVLALLAGGLTNAEIADRLVVSQRTAEHHVAAVMTKLGASTRRDAARRAEELGLASPR
jgi:DNA-binding CsgD family transcriptional regulator/tetratricopeptide (TPR) repeat protein